MQNFLKCNISDKQISVLFYVNGQALLVSQTSYTFNSGRSGESFRMLYDLSLYHTKNRLQQNESNMAPRSPNIIALLDAVSVKGHVKLHI